MDDSYNEMKQTLSNFQRVHTKLDTFFAENLKFFSFSYTYHNQLFCNFLKVTEIVAHL